MPNEPRWVDVETACRLNAEAVRRTGEPYGLRDSGLLASALAVPANHFFYEGEENVVSLAALLIVAVARNHPFQQGNKRTAFALGLSFLDVNGFDLTVDTLEFADLLVGVIEKRNDVADLAHLMTQSVTAMEG